MPVPQRIVDHVNAGGTIIAHNAQFERVMWKYIAAPRYGWPEAKMEQFVCSAAEAAAMALPRHLGGLSHVLGVDQTKDDKGYRLMLQMARPRKVNADGSILWWDVPAKKEILFNYCKQDLRTERACGKALRPLTSRERETYLLDQRVNDRGVRIDMDLVRAAQAVVDIGVTRANARLDDLTNGEVSAVTQNGRLLTWLNEEGIETNSISKKAIAALQERDDLAENIEAVLMLRASAGRSSVAKLTSFQLATCADNRARGLLLYHGATTGRWSGRLIQPHNFPRGEIKDVESFIPLVMEGEYDAIDLFHPPVIVVLSMLRAMLRAEEGHELIAADFSAIEARVLNWLAGQDDVVEVFREYDAAPKEWKHAYDPYLRMAEKMGRPGERQAGKAAELGCGFQMGAEKFVRAGWDVYQVRVTEEQAEIAVDSYRASHPQVKRFWKDAEHACLVAVRSPGVVQTFGGRANLRATCRGAYLYIILPSGRPLCYAAPKIKPREMPWCDACGKKQKEHDAGTHAFVPALKDSLHYWTVDNQTKQWVEEAAYGGLIVENIVQAVARDLLVEAMFRAEAAGYLPVLSVHDEIVCEVPVGHGSVKDFEQLMSELPAWADGCPVAAEGWAGARYRK